MKMSDITSLFLSKKKVFRRSRFSRILRYFWDPTRLVHRRFSHIRIYHTWKMTLILMQLCVTTRSIFSHIDTIPRIRLRTRTIEKQDLAVSRRNTNRIVRRFIQEDLYTHGHATTPIISQYVRYRGVINYSQISGDVFRGGEGGLGGGGGERAEEEEAQ